MDESFGRVQNQSKQENDFDESEDKPDASASVKSKKSKPIKKVAMNKPKKSQQKSVGTQNDEEVHSSYVPFGLFQSETQKCQRLDEYFRKDIYNHYFKSQLSPLDQQTLQSLVENNLFLLEDILHKDLSQTWGNNYCSLHEIRLYLEMIKQITESQDKFSILTNQSKSKYFCCVYRQNSCHILEISEVERKILEARAQYVAIFENCLKSEKNENKKIKQLNYEIAFLFKILYDSTKQTNKKIQKIMNAIQDRNTIKLEIPQSEYLYENYLKVLVKNLITRALNDEEINFYNFFRNNEIAEHDNGTNENKITDQKEFEEFIKKKKNKKGKKAKHPLHSACLGCMSYYSEQHNPFLYCQECFVRFHRSCYTGYHIRDQFYFANKEDNFLCETCFNKRNNPNQHMKLKVPQCDYCSFKGFLNISIGHSRRIHIFCMLIHGIWKVKDQKLIFNREMDECIRTNLRSWNYQKCFRCSSSNGILYHCQNCEKTAHPTCAYISGWSISVIFSPQGVLNNVDICCCIGEKLKANEERRLFITNFKRYAYNYIQ